MEFLSRVSRGGTKAQAGRTPFVKTLFGSLLAILSRNRVEFIIIGGVAGAVHGSTRATYVLDIVYRRTPENIQRLVEALTPLAPYLRDAPPNLPLVFFDVSTVTAGLNFMLATNLGACDLFGEVAGGGTYEALRPHAIEVELSGGKYLCADIESLLRKKQATGRPRDFEAAAEAQSHPCPEQRTRRTDIIALLSPDTHCKSRPPSDQPPPHPWKCASHTEVNGSGRVRTCGPAHGALPL